MTADTIKQKVIELISNFFKDKGFDVDVIEYVDFIDDLGMDSITFISIIVEIEALFYIEIPDDILLIENFKCVDDNDYIYFDDEYSIYKFNIYYFDSQTSTLYYFHHNI